MDKEKIIAKIEKLTVQDLNEVSVREEIVNPLLQLLGYESCKKNIIREAKFEKVDVMIGSKKETATYQADYYCETQNHKKWILEAKKTSYKIDDKAFYQAFSYVIHPKVNAELFVICNGRQLVLYSVKKRGKIFSFELKELKGYYPLLSDFLSYETFDDTMQYLKDLGLHLKAKNYTEDFDFWIHNVRFIDIIDENTVYIHTSVQYEENKFFASFMIDKDLFVSAHPFFRDVMKVAQIKQVYPLSVPLYDIPLSIHFQCHISNQIEEAETEFYVPIIISKFIDVILNTESI